MPRATVGVDAAVGRLGQGKRAEGWRSIGNNISDLDRSRRALDPPGPAPAHQDQAPNPTSHWTRLSESALPLRSDTPSSQRQHPPTAPRPVHQDPSSTPALSADPPAPTVAPPLRVNVADVGPLPDSVLVPVRRVERPFRGDRADRRRRGVRALTAVQARRAAARRQRSAARCGAVRVPGPCGRSPAYLGSRRRRWRAGGQRRRGRGCRRR